MNAFCEAQRGKRSCRGIVNWLMRLSETMPSEAGRCGTCNFLTYSTPLFGESKRLGIKSSPPVTSHSINSTFLNGCAFFTDCLGWYRSTRYIRSQRGAISQSGTSRSQPLPSMVMLVRACLVIKSRILCFERNKWFSQAYPSREYLL